MINIFVCFSKFYYGEYNIGISVIEGLSLIRVSNQTDPLITTMQNTNYDIHRFVNWTLRNKLQWNLYRNSYIFISVMHLNMPSGNWWQFCLGINMVKAWHVIFFFTRACIVKGFDNMNLLTPPKYTVVNYKLTIINLKVMNYFRKKKPAWHQLVPWYQQWQFM